jgi:hypothetical protein
VTDRLAELEAKAAALNAEIAALKAERPAPPPRPPRDEGVVRIVPVLDERSDGMPNLKELERLYAAVKHLAPWPLNDKYDDRKPFRGFSSCVRWLSNKGRTEQPNPKFALSFWLDNAKTWLRDRNVMTGDIDSSTLILAVYAAGDLKYVAANAQLGFTWEIALAEHGGRPASPDAWRRILREGASAILPPSSPARRMAPPSPARVIVGGY